MKVRDLISRQDAIDAAINAVDEWDGGSNLTREDMIADAINNTVPSAEPERLTDDDFETIRIHLNALKERLCNQRRWKEAEEYQRIIDRFMSFASAEPERKRGKWIGYNSDNSKWQRDDGSPIFLICSECGKSVLNNGSAYWNFCPNCGSYNGGEQE